MVDSRLLDRFRHIADGGELQPQKTRDRVYWYEVHAVGNKSFALSAVKRHI